MFWRQVFKNVSHKVYFSVRINDVAIFLSFHETTALTYVLKMAIIKWIVGNRLENINSLYVQLEIVVEREKKTERERKREKEGEEKEKEKQEVIFPAKAFRLIYYYRSSIAGTIR